MTTIWLIIGGVLAVAALLAMFRPHGADDLGAVSDRWIADRGTSAETDP